MVPTDLRKIAEGWTSELFEISDTTVLKLYRSGFEGVGRVEFEKTRYLQEFTPLVPRVFELLEVQGRSGYTMERIAGRPLGAAPELGDVVIARLLVDTQRHIRAWPTNALFPPVQERIAPRLFGARAALGALAERALALLATPCGAAPALCHGDYHPGNLLLAPGGVRVIDWNGAFTGPLEAEVAKSLLLMVCAPPTLAWGEALHGRGRAIARCYLQELRGARLVDDGALDRWLHVRLAEFLALPVPALHATLRPLAARWAERETGVAEDLWA